MKPTSATPAMPPTTPPAIGPALDFLLFEGAAVGLEVEAGVVVAASKAS